MKKFFAVTGIFLIIFSIVYGVVTMEKLNKKYQSVFESYENTEEKPEEYIMKT